MLNGGVTQVGTSGSNWLQSLLSGAGQLIPNIDVNIGAGGQQQPTPQQAVSVAALLQGTDKPKTPIVLDDPQYRLNDGGGHAPMVGTERMAPLIAQAYDNDTVTDATGGSPYDLTRGGGQQRQIPEYVPPQAQQPVLKYQQMPQAQQDFSNQAPPAPAVDIWNAPMPQQPVPSPMMNPYVQKAMQDQGRFMRQMNPYVQAGPYMDLPAVPPPVPIQRQPGLGNALRGIAGALAPRTIGANQANQYKAQVDMYNQQIQEQNRLREIQRQIFERAAMERGAAGNTNYAQAMNAALAEYKAMMDAQAGPKQTDIAAAVRDLAKQFPDPGPGQDQFILNKFAEGIDIRRYRGMTFPREVAMQEGREIRNEGGKLSNEYNKRTLDTRVDKAKTGLLREKEMLDITRQTKDAKVASVKLGAEIRELQKQIMAPKAATASKSNQLDMQIKMGRLAAQQRDLLNDQYKGHAAVLSQFFKFKNLQLNPMADDNDPEIAGLKKVFGSGKDKQLPAAVSEAFNFLQTNYPKELSEIRESQGSSIPYVGDRDPVAAAAEEIWQKSNGTLTPEQAMEQAQRNVQGGNGQRPKIWESASQSKTPQESLSHYGKINPGKGVNTAVKSQMNRRGEVVPMVSVTYPGAR